MKKEISSNALSVIKKMQQSELTESVIYEKIAKFAKGEENKQALLRLSREEAAHAEIWKKYTGKMPKAKKFKAFWFALIARIARLHGQNYGWDKR